MFLRFPVYGTDKTDKTPSVQLVGAISELKAELEKLPADRREQLEQELEKQD
jgi:hypothetical protein